MNPTLHTSSNTTGQRLSAMVFACLLTLGMLLSINSLAASEASPAQLARAAAHQHACKPV